MLKTAEVIAVAGSEAAAVACFASAATSAFPPRICL
ncbi:hypothetical protein J2805_000017 [Arthrobacter oryzae]|nr:hypothetical protein [Arthrobacter oryzae]